MQIPANAPQPLLGLVLVISLGAAALWLGPMPAWRQGALTDYYLPANSSTRSASCTAGRSATRWW